MGNVYSTLVNGLYGEFPKYVKLPPNSTLEEARNSEESRISVWRLVRLAAISAAGFAAIRCVQKQKLLFFVLCVATC